MLNSQNIIAFSLAVASIALFARKARSNKNTQSGVLKRRRKNRPVYGQAARDRHSQYYNWFREVSENSDTELFLRWTRMRKVQFDELLASLADHPLMSKKDTNFKKAITPGERLCLTLRFLAEGSGLDTLATAFRVAKSTCTMIVRDTLEAITDVLGEKHMKFPDKKQFIHISSEFLEKWNFPHCVGAMDGKHVRIQAPRNSGSEFYNYKNYFSVVLFAVCDAHYRFIYVDIGSYGSEGDAGIYASTALGVALSENKVDLPDAKPLPNMSTNSLRFPYMFVGDEAFPLRPYLARPFGGRNLSVQQRVYNYRLSRARRVIENAFGILVSKWRLFQKPILLKPSTVTLAVKAACCLHNYLRTQEIATGQQSYVTPGYVDSGDSSDGSWRNENSDLANFTNVTSGLASNHSSQDSMKLREYLCQYLNSEKGSVPWQVAHVNRGCI